MRVQIVTTYRHLQRYGVTVRRNVTSVYRECKLLKQYPSECATTSPKFMLVIIVYLSNTKVSNQLINNIRKKINKCFRRHYEQLFRKY
jgi:hypothetical protein